jgi:hypothetical protein
MGYVRALTLILSLVPLTIMRAHAQDGVDDPTICAEYVQSADLPDGLAFFIVMTNLSAMNLVDRESAIDSIQEGMGLSPSESEQFLDHLLRTLDSLKIEHDNITRDLACTPPPVGNEIYRVFEALDDAWETLGARYLAITKDELGEGNSARLQGWVESRKFSITHVMFRQKEPWEQSGGDPHEALLAICNGLDRLANRALSGSRWRPTRGSIRQRNSWLATVASARG